MVCWYDIPRVIIVDNGRQFDSDHYQDWCTELRIKAKYSSPGHLQANGQVEATNKTFVGILKKRLAAKNGTWLEELPTYYRRTELRYEPPLGKPLSP